ncbi:MAG: fibronectin type III domain-containing protein, partial [Flavobacteriaceae bacterium]
HTRYHVQYRKAGVADAEWFELSTYNQQAQISNLEAGTTYDFRVGGSCNALTVLDPNFTYGGVAQFSVPLQIGESEYQCGILPEIQITNTDPLEYIGVNETFTAGDFPVTVQSIEGKNGRFTGQGFIVVPYLAYTKIVVEFNGIQINTDYQLIDGEVVTTYDKTWSGVVDIGDGLEAIGGIIKEIVGLFERQQEILDEYSAETDPEKKENLLETYNTTILTINQKIDELKEEELITEEERHRLDEVRDIDKIASTDLTDQEVDNFKKLSNQKANVVNEIAESVEERKDEAFVVQAIDILGADIDFKNTFEDLKKIVEHFQNTLELCQKEGWESFEGKGIVPYCIWKEAEIPQALYYKKVDIPYISGIIDGVYQEIEGLVLLPKMIYDLSEGVNDFIYAYTYAKLLCTPVKTEMNKKRLEGLLAKLEETEKDGSIWGWVNEQWYTAQEYTVSSRQEKCEDAQKLRNEISQLLEYVSEIENIKKALADIEEQLSAYLGVLGSNDNRGRYEHGKITVIVASFFIPVAGQLSKIERVKKILQTLKTFTKTQWDELFTKFDDELGKLADAGSKFDNLVTKLNNLELPNLRGKLDGLDVGAKSRLADDLDGLSDDAIKQLEDNFGLLDEWKQIDELAISAQASRKPNWFQKILDGNEFNNIRSSSYPNNEVYLVNPKDPSRYVRLDSYKHLDEIISRKYTQFTDIQESTGLKYIQELKDKYPPGTKIANVPSNKLGGTNASLENISEINGQMVLEIPVQSNPIPQKILDEARTWSIKIRDVQGKIY